MLPAEKNPPAGDAQHALPANEREHLSCEMRIFCDSVVTGHIPYPWLPVPRRSIYDKIYVIHKGSGIIYVNNTGYEMRPGTVFIVPAGSIQKGETQPDTPILKTWIHFTASLLNDVSFFQLFPVAPAFGGATARTLARLAEEIAEAWSTFAVPERMLVTASAIQRIILHSRSAPAKDLLAPDIVEKDEAKERETANRTAHQVTRIRDIILWLQASCCDRLSLEQIAAKAHMAPSYFCRIFKRHTGLTPMKFLEQTRMRHARRLLLTTQQSIADIGRQTGYEDQYHFSRAFRRVWGGSPTDYRKEHLYTQVNDLASRQNPVNLSI